MAVFKYCLNCNSGGKVFFVTDQKIYIKLISGGGSCPPPCLAGESWKLRQGGSYFQIQDTGEGGSRPGWGVWKGQEWTGKGQPAPHPGSGRHCLPLASSPLCRHHPRGEGQRGVSEREGAQPTGSTEPTGRAGCTASLRPAQGPLNSVKTSLGAAGGPRILQIPPGRPTRGLDHMGLTGAPSLPGGVGGEGLSLTFLI